MARRRTGALWLLGGLAAGMAIWVGWPTGEARREAPTVATEAAQAVATASAVSSPAPPPAAAPTEVNDAISWRKLYATADLFPQLLQLHQARRKGSYAAVRAVNQACIEATLWSYYPDRDPLTRADVNHPDYAKRLAARELITTRCGHMKAGGGGAALMDIAAGDTEGRKFMQAFFTLQDPRGKSAEDLQEALAEVARQGHAEVMLMLYARYKGAQGLRALISEESAADAASAARIAAMKFTAPGDGLAEQDIRLAFRCFMAGECSYRYDDVTDFSDPERRARILRIAAELEAALRSPDPAAALFSRR